MRAYRLGRAEAEAKLAIYFTDDQWLFMSDVMHEAEDDVLNKTQGIHRTQDSGYISREDKGSDSKEESDSLHY